MLNIIPACYKNIYTTDYQARQINKIILKYVSKNSIITDATSCIGGNSKHFLKDFKYVNVVEKEKTLLDILKTNLSNYYNKQILICSYNVIKFMLRQDVIFLDPPWGGNLYKSKKTIDLFIDNVNVIDMINSLYHYSSVIALKIPNNFNISYITGSFWKSKIHNIEKSNKTIYKLIIFYK